jgi:hypothetical protein
MEKQLGQLGGYDEEYSFYLEIDKLHEKLQEVCLKGVEPTAYGYAVALEAVSELYQSLLAVPVISELESSGDVDGVERILQGGEG